MNNLLCCVAFVTIVLPSTLAGQTVVVTVVVDDNIKFVRASDFVGNYRGTVLQDTFGDFTSVWFDYDGSNLTAVSWNIDEESDWHVVNPGDAFGFASLASGQFTPIFTLDNARPPVFVGSDEFYLGVSTSGEGFDVGCCEVRNVFGWVRLRNNNGELAMVENAIAYNSQGIIDGTTQVIPEPPSSLLIAASILAGVLARRPSVTLSCAN